MPLVIVGAALGLQWSWVGARQLLQPTGEAAWIWIGGTTRWTGPRAFYAFRDFELAAVPPSATVTVLGDEEYVLNLNGKRVGSNRYRPSQPADRYEVADLLAEGNNRLVVHLRSSRGFGAFLLTLETKEGDTPLLVTGNDWKISQRYFRRLFRPDLELDVGFDATVVGRPPFGRWGTLSAAKDRAVHAAARADYRPLGPRRLLASGRRWRDLRRERRIDLGNEVLLDWGGIVEGYLTLRMPEEKSIIGLAYLGLRRPDPVLHPPDAFIIWTPRQPYWEDAVPRRFRYALLVGVEGASDPRVVVTDGEVIAAVEAGTRLPGLFGRPAPRSISPLEDEVWGELERFPRHTER